MTCDLVEITNSTTSDEITYGQMRLKFDKGHSCKPDPSIRFWSDEKKYNYLSSLYITQK